MRPSLLRLQLPIKGGVRMLAALRAREPRAAARSAVLILVVCAAAVAGLTIAQAPSDSGLALWSSWVAVALLVLGAVILVVVPAELLDRLAFGAMLALGGVLMACVLNLLTHDSSIAGQAFIAFSVLWAASHLRPVAVGLVTAVAVGGDAVILFELQPAPRALTDLVFFSAVLLVMAWMIARGGTTQERLVAALQEQARVDALTGLVNRRVFEEALQKAQPRTDGTAVVLIDVDAFKSINDAHGHPVGDQVLVHLAGVLRDHVRAEDAVLSRLGGDELAVLLPDCPPDVAARRAQELLDAVRACPLSLADGSLLGLSISVGVAHAPVASGDVGGLYSAADAALYEAKRAGRGRVAIA